MLFVTEYPHLHTKPSQNDWGTLTDLKKIFRQVGPCQINKNQINLDLIEMIQFYLNIYDLWRYPHLWLGECMSNHLKSNKS